MRFAALMYLWAFHLAQASQHRQQWCVVRSAVSVGKNTKRELGRELSCLVLIIFLFWVHQLCTDVFLGKVCLVAMN